MIVGFDGNVYPCDAMKYFDYLGSGGNIYESSLGDIFTSPYFEAIRKYKMEAADECVKCPQFACCKGGCLGQKMIAFVDTTHMTFKEYGDQALRTMKDFGSNKIKRMNGELGIIGELGEFFDSFKKLKTHELTVENKEKILKNLAIEAGDIMWYIAASLSNSIDWSILFRRMIIQHAHKFVFAEKPHECVSILRPRTISKELFEEERFEMIHWHGSNMAAENDFFNSK